MFLYLDVNIYWIFHTDGLAVDWINDKLYFSYAGSTNNYHMAVYDIVGENWEVLLTSSVRYYEIAVDPMAQ